MDAYEAAVKSLGGETEFCTLIGGYARWIQSDGTPVCVHCQTRMNLYVRLHFSVSKIRFLRATLSPAAALQELTALCPSEAIESDKLQKRPPRGGLCLCEVGAVVC